MDSAIVPVYPFSTQPDIVKTGAGYAESNFDAHDKPLIQMKSLTRGLIPSRPIPPAALILSTNFKLYNRLAALFDKTLSKT
uniref:Uncharacterized protein n=1 Tax=Glossina palpalis gambiensis TaxID=67801 RepID=A0A1B0BN62_9MUSC